MNCFWPRRPNSPSSAFITQGGEQNRVRKYPTWQKTVAWLIWFLNLCTSGKTLFFGVRLWGSASTAFDDGWCTANSCTSVRWEGCKGSPYADAANINRPCQCMNWSSKLHQRWGDILVGFAADQLIVIAEGSHDVITGYQQQPPLPRLRNDKTHGVVGFHPVPRKPPESQTSQSSVTWFLEKIRLSL